MSATALDARLPKRRLETALALATAATVAVGLLGGRSAFGEPLPPFLMRWGPRAGPLLPLSLIVLAAAVALASRLAAPGVRPRNFAFASYGLALALGIALSAGRTGWHGLWAIFQTGPGGSYEAHNEYLPGLPALAHGVAYYVYHFPALVLSLPVHVVGNPRGRWSLCTCWGSPRRRRWRRSASDSAR